MGKELIQEHPDIDITFYDIKAGKILGQEVEERSEYFQINDKIPDYSEAYSFGGITMGHMVRRDYYRDMVDYLEFKYSYIPIHFALINRGKKEAVNIQVELECDTDIVDIKLDGEEVKRPIKDSLTMAITTEYNYPSSAYSIEKLSEQWRLSIGIDRLHAKRTIDLAGIIYTQVKDSHTVLFKAKVFFDGETTPVEKNLAMNVNCEVFTLSWKDFKQRYLQNELLR